MDPLSQRLRKQRERSWMQTRQLNKNASTILRRQLKVMEQRQQHIARLLKREKEQVAQALDAVCNSRHVPGPPREGEAQDEEEKEEEQEGATGNDVSGGVERTKMQKLVLLSPLCPSPPFHGRFALPPVWQTWKPGSVLGEKRDPGSGSGDSPSRSCPAFDSCPTQQGRVKVLASSPTRRDSGCCWQETATGETTPPSLEAAWLSSWDPNLTQPASSQTSSVSSLPDQVHLYQHIHPHHSCRKSSGAESDDDKDEGSLQCRYRAFSRHSPCRYFPCSEPLSYHNLVASQHHGHVLLKTSQAALAAQLSIPALGSQGMVSTAIFPDSGGSTDPKGGRGFYATTTGVSTNTVPARHRRPQADVNCPLVTSSTAFASPSTSTQGRAVSACSQARGLDGHIAPRTSIEERLRGLGQLVRELRDKNEAKRPKDWAVNYGQAVSRRLIRKPLVIGPSQV